MNAGLRLTLFGAALVVAFAAAYGLAHALVPESFVQSWMGSSEPEQHGGSQHE